MWKAFNILILILILILEGILALPPDQRPPLHSAAEGRYTLFRSSNVVFRLLAMCRCGIVMVHTDLRVADNALKAYFSDPGIE